MSYIEIKFGDLTNDVKDVIIALLADLNFEGFEEEENLLKAFVASDIFNEQSLKEIVDEFHVMYTITELPDVNWNKEWESNFQPVIVENFCAIRADFHQSIKNVEHEIIITPKMSFGTGHHATTYMMIQQMQDLSFTNKSVLDFGTGTGVLAILAHQLGAASVTAIDNDLWSIENATENFKKNNVDDIDLKLADHPIKNDYDILLANITRNVIQQYFSAFGNLLNTNGILLLSGLLYEDEILITSLASAHHFSLEKKLQQQSWISLRFIKN